MKVNINDQINESSKSTIMTNRDRSDNKNNTLSDTYKNLVNVKSDIVVLYMGTNDIFNPEDDKDLIAESVIDIAKECFPLGVKDAFASSVKVNTRCSSAFISAVNNILQDKCATHQFHFIG